MVERVSELKELKGLLQAWGLEEAEAKNAAIYIIYGSRSPMLLFKPQTKMEGQGSELPQINIGRRSNRGAYTDTVLGIDCSRTLNANQRD